MKYLPWWPARVLPESEALSPKPNTKGPWVLVYFFNDHDRQAFIHYKDIEMFFENRHKHSSKRKAVLEAMAHLEEFAEAQARSALAVDTETA
jgi:hypothetical protein